MRLGNHNVDLQSAMDNRYEVSRIVRHPEFDENTRNNDLMLLQLDTKIEFSELVIAPICFDDGAAFIFVGISCFLTEWKSNYKGSSCIFEHLRKSVQCN